MSLSRLHKFKLFATRRSFDSSAAANPTTSPSKSPVFSLRRRKTLGMLFEKSSGSRRRNLRQILEESRESDGSSGKKKRGDQRSRCKLKELLVTSPSRPFKGREEIDEGGEGRSQISPVTVASVTCNADGPRELTARRLGSVQSFRLRILRKPWRPVLVTIPEQ